MITIQVLEGRVNSFPFYNRTTRFGEYFFHIPLLLTNIETASQQERDKFLPFFSEENPLHILYSYPLPIFEEDVLKVFNGTLQNNSLKPQWIELLDHSEKIKASYWQEII